MLRSENTIKPFRLLLELKIIEWLRYNSICVCVMKWGFDANFWTDKRTITRQKIDDKQSNIYCVYICLWTPFIAAAQVVICKWCAIIAQQKGTFLAATTPGLPLWCSPSSRSTIHLTNQRRKAFIPFNTECVRTTQTQTEIEHVEFQIR